MAELYLFGSRARGDHNDKSDFDVFMDSCNVNHIRARMIINFLRPYAVEYGGRLDFFELLGDELHAVYDEHGIRRVLLDKHSFRALQVDAEPIALIELVQLMKGA